MTDPLENTGLIVSASPADGGKMFPLTCDYLRYILLRRHDIIEIIIVVSHGGRTINLKQKTPAGYGHLFYCTELFLEDSRDLAARNHALNVLNNKIYTILDERKKLCLLTRRFAKSNGIPDELERVLQEYILVENPPITIDISKVKHFNIKNYFMYSIIQ
jgi:hypothetical protein